MSKHAKCVAVPGSQGPIRFLFSVVGDGIKKDSFLVVTKNNWWYNAWFGQNTPTGLVTYSQPATNYTSVAAATKDLEESLKRIKKEKDGEVKEVNDLHSFIQEGSLPVPEGYYVFTAIDGGRLLVSKEWAKPMIESTGQGTRLLFPAMSPLLVKESVIRVAQILAGMHPGGNSSGSNTETPQGPAGEGHSQAYETKQATG